MSLDLDPRYTFDAFIVGPANRLAVAAARRVSDSPGAIYNPLFIYSGSGLGKTHLLGAIGHQVAKLHSMDIVYDTVERLMEEISMAVERGERDAFRGRLRDTDLLLLDDIQFVAGQRQVQEELLRAWDAFSTRGAQVVLTSDRPPQEMDGLDDRLLSRLSGGLIVDMSPPDYETRIAIARRKAEERGIRLSPAVYQALARIAFTNVRELQGSLNRLIAIQELEGRTVGPEEVATLLGSAAERGADEFGEFLSDITGTVSAVVEEGDRQVADAILAWEGEGYQTRRLDAALSGTITAAQAEALVRRFEGDVVRLKAITAEIRELQSDAPELDSEVLRDPDRLTEAEALLAVVRERQSPLPAPPEGPGLGELQGLDALAVRAARAVADAPAASYNPLFVLGPVGSGRTTLLVALARALRDRHQLRVAYTHAAAFAEELIGALERNRLGAWRARYRKAEALILEDLDQLAGMERGQEELFHLFEELTREGRQLVFSATVPPRELPLPDRLRSRLEAGLVVELEEPAASGADADSGAGSDAGGGSGADGGSDACGGSDADGEGELGVWDLGTAEVEASDLADLSSLDLDSIDLGMPDFEALEQAAAAQASAEETEEAAEAEAEAGTEEEAPSPGPVWLHSAEKVLWEWPYAEDWIQESPD